MAKTKQEQEEKPADKIVCEKCNNDKFRIYIEHNSFDGYQYREEAKFYCTKCGHEN